jgi:hypothetical protein
MAKTVERMLEEAQVEEAALQIDAWLDLSEISPDLAVQIERLAPFGPGNEEPVLATRNLTLKSAAPVGRNQDHLKMIVENSTGSKQTVIWWGGGGEPLPDGLFDLAYTLRASDFRGTPQITVELTDIRASESDAVQLRSETREINDWREEDDPGQRLAELLAQGDPLVLVWAEGTAQKAVHGLGRHQLTESETLVIWSAPPSREVLADALARVRAKRLILVGVDPGDGQPRAFRERLRGLVKFVVTHKAGHVTLDELAAATAQPMGTIRSGLDYLASRGEVIVEFHPRGRISLAAGGAAVDEAAAEELKTRLERMLQETAAYRAYFARAEKPVE